MPSLNFNVLRSPRQLKGWSNRPEVPLISRWRKKKSKPSPSPSSPRPMTAPSSPTAAVTTVTERSVKPLPAPVITKNSSSRTASTTNVLLIHPLCRCCTDVVNSITRPYKQRASKATNPSGSSARKPTWDGLPSTHYMRLWPQQPEEEKLRQAKVTPDSRFATCSSPLREKKQKKKQKRPYWKFWPSIV